MDKTNYITVIPNEASMLMFGGQLAGLLVNEGAFRGAVPRILFLYGQLGAGKTTLVRGLLQSLGHTGRVKSPTYTLVEPYELLKGTVFHFDLYRLQSPQELESLGIQDYFVSHAICIIEWPEQGKGILPIADLSCYINPHRTGREITCISHSDFGETILQRLKNDN